MYHQDLLIVPYGIETKWKNFPFFLNGLLIVPYGIETTYEKSSIQAASSF